MIGFSDNYNAIDKVLNKQLADWVYVTKNPYENDSGDFIMALFEWESGIDDKLKRRDSDSFAYLTDILPEDSYLFEDWKDLSVWYRNKWYSVFDFYEMNDRKFRADLRVKRLR